MLERQRPTKSTTMRLPQELRERLKTCARLEGRTMANLTLRLLEEGLKARAQDRKKRGVDVSVLD